MSKTKVLSTDGKNIQDAILYLVQTVTKPSTQSQEYFTQPERL